MVRVLLHDMAMHARRVPISQRFGADYLTSRPSSTEGVRKCKFSEPLRRILDRTGFRNPFNGQIVGMSMRYSHFGFGLL